METIPKQSGNNPETIQETVFLKPEHLYLLLNAQKDYKIAELQLKNVMLSIMKDYNLAATSTIDPNTGLITR